VSLETANIKKYQQSITKGICLYSLPVNVTNLGRVTTKYEKKISLKFPGLSKAISLLFHIGYHNKT